MTGPERGTPAANPPTSRPPWTVPLRNTARLAGRWTTAVLAFAVVAGLYLVVITRGRAL